ncbi:MAG: hypothetical protein L3J89_00965 [Gammaproteobacteria bacterium]|nr:hypothetical protein [Gammaproteobacteria bacterium]
MNKNQTIQKSVTDEINDFIEPCFLNSTRWINTPANNNIEKIAHYLSHQISRMPQDLTSHAQRISLYLREGDTENTYAALLDLFLVLGNKGLPLRKRLLQQAVSVITAENYGFLSSTLPTALVITCNTPLSHLSALSLGRTSEKKIIRKTSDEQSQKKESPLLIVRDLLNSGQISQAQSILESALLTEPDNDDISDELLQIYRHTHDRSGCIQMLKKLSSSPLAGREKWTELIITLDQDSMKSSLSA